MGGVESHCEELLPRIARLDSDFDIEVLGRRPYRSDGGGGSDDIRVTWLPSPRKRSLEAIVSTVVGIIHARAQRADLVHIHAIGPALAAPLARLLGMRVVFTHHGEDYERAKWGCVAKAMLRAGERLGVITSNATIAVSGSLAEDLKRRFPRHAGKVHHIPNGAPRLPEEGSAPDILSGLGVSAGDYILAVSRLVPEKGLHILVDAFHKSAQGRKLLIVGGADHGSPYSRGLLSRASDTVIFAGVQPRSILKHAYANADRFVLPSFHEGLPIAALEAGLIGCPMLLSDIRPNLDIGLTPANYFKAGDVDALASALLHDRSEQAVSADFFRSTYDWDEIAARTLDVYRSAVR